jgi:hypothetical protein
MCLPQDKDQFANCDRINAIIAGKTLRPVEANAEALKQGLTELISNQNFKKSLTKLRSIMNFYKGDKRAADLIISFAEVGYEHLIPRWFSLPWYQKNELDIFVVYGLSIALIIYGVKWCFRTKPKVKKD